jgi:hypothetical protein
MLGRRTLKLRLNNGSGVWMMNLRSVGALLAISAALSCATAINQEAGVDPSPMAGSDSGGGAGLAEEGGAPAGGAPQAGAPAEAGKGGAGKGGGGATGGGGKGGSGGATGTAGRGGSGGSVGVAGSAGSSAAGRGGTSSGGTGGGSAGSIGTAGGTSTGPCENPVDLPATAMNTGNIGTAAACFRTKATFNTIVCSNMADRMVKVNGMSATCGVKTAFPPAIETWNYFDITAGAMSYAQLGWFTS